MKMHVLVEKSQGFPTKDNLPYFDEEMAVKLDTSGRKWVVFLSVFELLFAIPFFVLFTTCFLDKEWIDVWYFIHYLKDNQTEYVERSQATLSLASRSNYLIK